MMKQEVKDKWIEALRSGEYEQGIGRLRSSENKFCCLGVLCEVQGVESHLNHDEESYRYFGNKNGFQSLLPSSVAIDDWKLPYEDTSILMGMNDNGKSFNEIADWIEENVKVTA